MYKTFLQKLEESRLHGRHINKWEDSIKMAPQVIRCEVWERD